MAKARLFNIQFTSAYSTARWVKLVAAFAIFGAGPLFYAAQSAAVNLQTLCVSNFFAWGGSKQTLACSGSQASAQASTVNGHHAFAVNLDVSHTACSNGGIVRAEFVGMFVNGPVYFGWPNCFADDFTADGASVGNSGDGTCDGANDYRFLLDCYNPCANGCPYNPGSPDAQCSCGR